MAQDVIQSAGTLIAAALETAGYVSQSEVLHDFQALFDDWAALLYMVAALGAIVSVAIYGSYRAARYFVFGPALFQLFVYSVTPAENVQWAMGSTPVAQEAVQGALSGDLATYNVTSDTKVSWVFDQYTRFVSSVVNKITSTIVGASEQTNAEGKNELLFLTRGVVLDQMFASDLVDGNLVAVVRSSLNRECGELSAAYLGVADPKLQYDYFEHLTKKASEIRTEIAADAPPESKEVAIAQAVELEKAVEQGKATREQYEEIICRAEEYNVSLKGDPTLREYLVKDLGTTDLAGFKDRYGLQLNPLTYKEVEAPDFTMTCGELWSYIAAGVKKNAKYRIEEVLAEYTGRPGQPKQRVLCNEIRQVFGMSPLPSEQTPRGQRTRLRCGKEVLVQGDVTDPGGNSVIEECNLENVLGAMLIKRAIGQRAPSRWLQDFGSRVQLDAKLSAAQVKSELESAQQAGTQMPEVLEVEFKKIASVDAFNNAFGEQQTYTSYGLRQAIFSAALTFPYFQGVILYLLCIVFPFMAVVLVMPGKAESIFTWFLLWFWVKSWDIGFAVAMVLEKVLWNLMPHYDVLEKTSLTAIPPEDILTHALSGDPIYHINTYYALMAMSIMSTPVLMGFGILKGRAAILSSFTHAVSQTADESKELGEGRYAVKVMNMNHAAMTAFKNAAGLSARSRDLAYSDLAPWGESGRGKTNESSDGGAVTDHARQSGMIRGVSSGAGEVMSSIPGLAGKAGNFSKGSKASKLDKKNAKLDSIDSGLGIAQTGIDKYLSNYKRLYGAGMSREFQEQHWKVRLSHSVFTMIAQYNSIDGGGGFELELYEVKALWSSLSSAYKEDTETFVGAAEDLGGGAVKGLSGGFDKLIGGNQKAGNFGPVTGGAIKGFVRSDLATSLYLWSQNDEGNELSPVPMQIDVWEKERK
ncbi:hypothetical protein JNK13_05490 [bacterium]|nr:hypothetical protein [bacterium]